MVVTAFAVYEAYESITPTTPVGDARYEVSPSPASETVTIKTTPEPPVDDAIYEAFKNGNIDLAPRLDGLSVGDTVGFRGEYVWNDEGGLVHWTHHDPNGKHADGWLKWGDTVYK